MKYDPAKHHRRSIRLKGYDYTQPGAYFVTLVTWQRECLFGEVVDGEMRLNNLGEMVSACWRRLPGYFSNVRWDEFIMMPNHVHGIICLVGAETERWPDGNMTGSTPGSRVSVSHGPVGTKPGSLGAIVQNFKAISTRKINQFRASPGAPAWQRNYYERIIRDEVELTRCRQYMGNNPLQWELDQENPCRHLQDKTP